MKRSWVVDVYDDILVRGSYVMFPNPRESVIACFRRCFPYTSFSRLHLIEADGKATNHWF